MNNLRTIHAIGAFLAAAAAMFAVFGLTRAAIAAIAIDLILFAWSLETLRHAILTSREPRP